MQVLGYSFRGLGLRALDCVFAWGSGRRLWNHYVFRAWDLGFRVEHMGMHKGYKNVPIGKTSWRHSPSFGFHGGEMARFRTLMILIILISAV